MLFALGDAFGRNSNTLAVLDGRIMYRSKPVTTLTDVVQVVARGTKVMAVTRSGGLYHFRFQGYRDLEPYSPEIRVLRHNIPVERVAMGSDHVIAVLSDGNVVGQGTNNCGCLGFEPKVPCQYFRHFMYIGGGDLAAGSAASVFAGHHASAVIDVHGVLHVQGYNSYGQLGLGHDENVPEWRRVNLKSVVFLALDRHSLAVLRNGSMYATGKNTCGQLGVGHRDDLTSFARVCGGVASAAVGQRHSVVVLKNGDVLESGYMKHSSRDAVLRFTQTQGLPPMAAVAAGDGRCAAMTGSGAVFSWGPYVGGFGEGPLPDLPHDRDMPPTMMLAGISLAERTRPLPEAHALAFVMGLHARVGGESAHGTLPGDVVRRIVETCALVESASERAERGC